MVWGLGEPGASSTMNPADMRWLSRGAQSIRRRIRQELAGVYTRGLGTGPDPVTFAGVLLSCPGTPPVGSWLVQAARRASWSWVTSTSRSTAQRNPTISRATAVAATGLGFLAARRWNRV